MERLIWNFEINPAIADICFSNKEVNGDETHWEVRYFWPEESIIVLQGLTKDYLNLSQYHYKHRDDVYILLANENYNIKLRRDELLFKPLLHQRNNIMGFGPKIKLTQVNDQHFSRPLPSGLFEKINQEGHQVRVVKEAVIYKWSTPYKTKMELARLTTKESVFFSLSLESRCFEDVQILATQIMRNQNSSDYVSFLKKILAC